MHINVIVGARPQFIKLASLFVAARTFDRSLKITVTHTGQHYDPNMSEIFFRDLEMPMPDFFLEVGSGNHGAQTGRMLEKIEQVLTEQKPDWVLVYGDTNSTLAGALAANKLHIPVAHVEAGLRSFNRLAPEETNRVLTDHCSDILFPPTEVAVKHLRNEGISANRIHKVGDVMYDASLYFSKKAQSHSRLLEKLGAQSKEYILATVHRAQNTDRPETFAAILDGLLLIAQKYKVIFPVHPRTRKLIPNFEKFCNSSSGIQCIDPVGYLEMQLLESQAKLICTDSGGVQKEAFFFSVPCVTLRDETEWTELVEMKWSHLTPPTNAEAIFSGVERAMNTLGVFFKPYGTGDASLKILQSMHSTHINCL